jgi:hypothetical protein
MAWRGYRPARCGVACHARRVKALSVALVLTAAACGGHHHVLTAGGAAADGTPVFAAARYVPAQPTYVLSARSVRDLQRTVRDVADSFGGVLGGARALSEWTQHTMGFDVLGEDSLLYLGIDLGANVAVFSEELTPTIVVHLGAPETFAAFIDHARSIGLKTSSIVVDGIELSTASLPGHAAISWGVAGNDLWLHFADQDDHATTWFQHSRAPTGTAWLADWAWATANQPGPVHGLVRVHDLLAIAQRFVPALASCAAVIAPIARASITTDGDGHRSAGWISLDLGAAAAGALASHVLPIPEGWQAATGSAALAVQWNLELGSVIDSVSACVPWVAPDLFTGSMDGIRAGRAAVLSFAPQNLDVTAAASVELSNHKLADSLLDKVPARRLIEHDHTFGPLAGHTIAVPSMPTVDYVLTDKQALVGVGDGLLAKVIGHGGTVTGPLASLDIRPDAMSMDAWTAGLRLVLPYASREVSMLLSWWKSGHLELRLDGTKLVLEARGERR